MTAESRILRVTVRSWVTMALTLTVCWLACIQLDVPDVLANGFSMAIGFLFGQKAAHKEEK